MFFQYTAWNTKAVQYFCDADKAVVLRLNKFQGTKDQFVTYRVSFCWLSALNADGIDNDIELWQLLILHNAVQ